jgi:FHA domain
METMERDLFNRIEFFVRRIFERIGGAIDFALRRGGQTQSGARTDLSALTPQIERAIENNLRREGSRLIAPNLIELRYDYETYTGMGQKRREFLQRELSSSSYEFIYNRRYQTLGRMQVRISYDAFTRGLEIKVDFGEGKRAVIVKGRPARQIEDGMDAQPGVACSLVLFGTGTHQELRARASSDAEPLGIGRNIANRLVIKDPTVSNFHAAFLLRSDGTLELADRSSANGTYVNGVKLGTGDRTIVREGDRLRFGEVEMVLSVRVNEEG